MSDNKLPEGKEPHKDVIDIFLHMFYIRRRFHGKMPEQILKYLRANIQEHSLREKLTQINERDVFFTVGFVFSLQPEPITMGELSRVLGVPFSTTTRIVDWLVENGYVQRLADPEDRRVVRVELTDSGRELYRVINDILLKTADQFLKNFSLEERKELGRLLGKLVDNLENYPM